MPQKSVPVHLALYRNKSINCNEEFKTLILIYERTVAAIRIGHYFYAALSNNRSLAAAAD